MAKLDGRVGRGRDVAKPPEPVRVQLLREGAELVVLEVAREHLAGEARRIDDGERGDLVAQGDDIGGLATEDLGQLRQKGWHAPAAAGRLVVIVLLAHTHDRRARVHLHHASAATIAAHAPVGHAATSHAATKASAAHIIHSGHAAGVAAGAAAPAGAVTTVGKGAVAALQAG